MGLRGAHITYLILVSTSLSFGISEQDRTANQKLAEKMLSLSQSVEMKEARYSESGGGAKDFDANTGNSYASNTTYHYWVRNICLNWLRPKVCDQWLPPYASKHGKDGDRSPLEGLVWDENAARGGLLKGGAGAKQVGGQTNLGIWVMNARNGGSIIDNDGKLDVADLTRWEIVPDVKQKIGQIGTQTTEREMAKWNASEDRGSMIPPEALRLMASRWTRMMRNRMVASLGELRTMDRRIEFALDETAPDCEMYLAAMQQEMDRFKKEQRRDEQANLDYETTSAELEDRYNLCVKMRQTSVYAVNPKAYGNDVKEGGAAGEEFDKWRYRANIAAIDAVGIDPNSLPHPPDAEVRPDEYTQEMTDYDNGGNPSGTKYMTNAQQIEARNLALREAAEAMRDIASKNPEVNDTSDRILSYQEGVGEKNAVVYNSLTGAQKDDLASSGVQASWASNNLGTNTPETNLELRPADVAVARR